MVKLDSGGLYAPVPSAVPSAEWDDDEVVSTHVHTNGHRVRSAVDAVDGEGDDDTDLNDDESAVHDDAVGSTRKRSCAWPVFIAVLVSIAMLIAVIVSYEDQVPLPPLPATVNTKVDELRQMFTWRAVDTPLAYQPLPSPVALSNTPPAVAALQACQSAYSTTRALLVVLSSAADAASLDLLVSHTSSVHKDSMHGFCILAISTTTESASSQLSTATANSSQAQPVTCLTVTDLLSLRYEYVREARQTAVTHGVLNIPFAKTAGSLLLMHAGFDVIIDVHTPLAVINSAERVKQITTIDYTAATYITGDDIIPASPTNTTNHHCSATVQLTSASNALLTHYQARSKPAALVALNSHELLAVEPSSTHATTVFSPAFAGMYLPSSASSLEAAYTFRSLVYRTFLSFLWVPTRSSAFLSHHGLAENAATTPSTVGTPREFGPAPVLLRQSHISACVVRWIHSEGDQQPQTEQADRAKKEADDETEQADEAVQLRRTVQLLSDSMLGHTSDAQQVTRQVLLASNMELGEAMRRSQEAHQLLGQIYTYISQHSTGVVSTQDIRELRAFHSDMRNIALTLQQSRSDNLEVTAQPPPASTASTLTSSLGSGPLSPYNNILPAVVVPRQSRIAVCIQFNYAAEDHSLHLLLTYHARLHHHLMLSMPIRAAELSPSQRVLLAQFPDITFLYCASYRGYFQYRCLHQCLVQSRASHTESSGMLFIADDAWFNFTQTLVQWDKWLPDEFWYHSKAYLMDMSKPFKAYYGSFESQWFHEGRDYHVRLQRSYYSWPQRYRDALNSVYGQDFVATEALSDILYVPRADAQMDNLIEVLAEQIGQVDVWCEVMTAVLVDLAMILSGHRPNLPIFPAISQQVAIFLNQRNYKDKDGVVRYIDGVQLDADHLTHPHRFYQYMRRGATAVTQAMQNDSLMVQDKVAASMTRFPGREKGMAYWWLDEMEQMRLQHRTADFYDTPQSVGSCALHYGDDGFIPSSALRPVLLRPDGNIVLPHRKNVKLARLLVDDDATGWIHPIKMSERSSEFTQLGVESLNRMVVQMSGLLWEDEWWRRRTQCGGESGGEAQPANTG